MSRSIYLRHTNNDPTGPITKNYRVTYSQKYTFIFKYTYERNLKSLNKKLDLIPKVHINNLYASLKYSTKQSRYESYISKPSR